jgi:hypothetical protein
VQKAKSAESRKDRAKSEIRREQRGESREQRSESREQRAESKEEEADATCGYEVALLTIPGADALCYCSIDAGLQS